MNILRISSARCCATCEHEESTALGHEPCLSCMHDYPAYWKPKGLPDSHPTIPITLEEGEAFRALEQRT